ncbi:MAG: shikimate kinase [Saprospiraceae bacterium]
MKKINVIGTSGSGKSTFSRQLSEALGIPYIEMDAIFWEKDWNMPKDKVFFQKLKMALKQEKWVLDGNYSRTNDLKWKEVDTIIWIDFSFARTFYQAIRRAINRVITKKELWPGTGNRESFKQLLSKDSIVWWTLKTYKRNRVKYLKVMDNPNYKHIEFIHLKTPKACKEFLYKIKQEYGENS